MRIRRKYTLSVVLTCICACVTGPVPWAAESVSSNDTLPLPKEFLTHHQITTNGSKVAFTVRAGETYIYGDNGHPTGSIFSYAYTADGARPANRPVMFVMGGGPGSASDTLNVGLLGPWTVAQNRLALQGAHTPASVPPFGVAENHNSLLDATDLVFIDPIGTGYSHPVGPGKGQDFWGIDEDLEALAQFIQLWLSKNGRWDSPKFFLGESYGGTRAALIPNILLGGPNYPGYTRAISLNGVIVMSNGLGWPVGADGIGTTWLSASSLPDFAATAWYHNRIDRKGRTLRQFYDEVWQFASGEFVIALQKEAVQVLPPEERQAVVAKLCGFTGLPAAAFEKSLSISASDFAQALLADSHLRISVYDSRYTAPAANNGEDAVADDPFLMRAFPVFGGAFLEEESTQLKVHMDRPYAAIHFRDLNAHWNYTRRATWVEGSGDQYKPKHFKTNAEELAVAMTRNDSLYAMVVTGYYDLLLTPAQAKYATEQAGIPKDRLILEPVEAGHMPYVDSGATPLINDIRAMVRKASH